jgi:hypothetical protein
MASATKIVTDRLPDHLPELPDFRLPELPDLPSSMTDVSKRARKAAQQAQKAASRAQKKAGGRSHRSFPKGAIPVVILGGVALYFLTRSRRSSATVAADRSSDTYART